MTVRPRSLHNYIEKCDYIKGRRPSPYNSLRDIPKQKTKADTERYLEMAIMASMRMSSVGFEEELYFDSSLEGTYYAIWQSVKSHFKWPEDPYEGVDAAEKWYSKLDDESKSALRSAIRGVDERRLAKNSDGPEENPTKGPEETSVQTGISHQSEVPTAT